MSMEPQEYIAAEIARHEGRWRKTRDKREIAACFEICAANDIPVPDWAQPAIRQAITPGMSKFPYGGFEVESGSEDDSGWDKLRDIKIQLEDGEALPPFLAHWLGNAIERAGGDPNELLRLLELKPRPGRPRHKFTKQDEWTYGARVCELEDDGLSPEAAKRAVLEEFEDGGPSRSQLQKWRDEYRRAMEEAEAATK